MAFWVGYVCGGTSAAIFAAAVIIAYHHRIKRTLDYLRSRQNRSDA